MIYFIVWAVLLIAFGVLCIYGLIEGTKGGSGD